MLLEYNSLERPLFVVREDVKHDLVGVPEVSFSSFAAQILPSLKAKVNNVDLAVDKIFLALQTERKIVGDRFKHFKSSPSNMKLDVKSGVDTSDQKATEDAIYANMRDLWSDVVEKAKSKERCATELQLFDATSRVARAEPRCSFSPQHQCSRRAASASKHRVLLKPDRRYHNID